MFNLLRMDLYRLKRSKSLYIWLAVLMAISVLCYWMVWLINTPEGRSLAGKIDMVLTEETLTQEDLAIAENYDLLAMFRETGMDGGGFTCITGILAALFVCLDFHSGFMKNIMALHRDRWKYVASKLITAGILNFFYLAVLLAFSFLLNACFGVLVPWAGIGSIAFYMVSAWILSTAFSALFILVILLTRSSAAGVTAALLLGSGLVQLLLLNITGLFHVTKWFDYTLYANLTYAPTAYAGIGDWKGAATGLVFLVLYSVLGCAVLARQDI